jgi:hypothetical protein
MPDVSMPAGSTVTSLGANPVEYSVKAAEYKLVFETTDTTTPCTASPSSLAVSDSLTLPTEDGWSMPSHYNTEADVTLGVKVIAGVCTVCTDCATEAECTVSSA